MAPARVALVRGDDGELGARAREHERRVEPVAAPHALPQRPAGDQRGLDHLGPARGELLRRQRRERGRVDEHRRRLVVGAGVVLALRQVDAGLAPVGGVDLRDERRRHLHDRDAALVGGGAEAREVADDAAAEREHVVAVLHPGPGEAAQHAPRLLPGLRRLAGRDGDRRRHVAEALAVEAPDRLVGHEEGAAVHGRRHAAEDAPPDEHRVVARRGARPHELRARRRVRERAQVRQRAAHHVARGVVEDRVGQPLVERGARRRAAPRTRRGRARAAAACRPRAATPWPCPRRAARPCGRRAPPARAARRPRRRRATAPGPAGARAARRRAPPPRRGTRPRRARRSRPRSACRAAARAGGRSRRPARRSRRRPPGRRSSCPRP